MAKKENKFFNIFFIVTSIFLLYVSVRSCYDDMKHPRPFAPPGWDKIEVNDIETVTLSPLLLHHGIQTLTIDRNIGIIDRDTIMAIWKKMQGKERARQFTGHWFTKEQFKIVFHLSSGKKMAFEITFHAGKNVAKYYRLINPDSFFAGPGDSDKGSPQLYNILAEVIEKSNIKWVLSIKDCWNIEGALEYVGCPYFEKAKTDL